MKDSQISNLPAGKAGLKSQKYGRISKNSVQLFLAVSTILLVSHLSLLISSADASTGINKTINFQGKLSKSDGTNVADSTYSVVFTLYDSSSGGTNLWTETQSVTTSNGIFQVALGSVTSLAGVNFNSDTIYLGIKVGSDSEMTPRIRFAAVPYALNADKLNGVTATQSATGFNLQGGSSSLSTVSFTTSGSTLTLQPGLAGGLTIQSNGANGLTFDTGGGAAINIGNTSATSLVFGNSTSNPSFSFNGTGGLTVANGGNNNITLGSNAGNGTVVIQPNAGGQAGLIVNDQGSGDIFTASASGQTKFVINQNGNVNIGTQSAAIAPYKLYVSDYSPATASAMIENTVGLSGGVAGECTSNIDCTVGLAIKMGALGSATNPGSKDRYLQFMRGDGLVVGKFQGNNTAGVSYTANGADYAEYFKKEIPDENLQPGDLVCLGVSGGVTACTDTTTSVIGVVSNRAIVIGNDHENDQDYVIVGLVGQLPLKVSTMNGVIHNGDPLTASSIPGVAMKATGAGEIIGRSLDAYDDMASIGEVSSSVSRTWYDSDIALLNLDGYHLTPSSESATQNTFILTDAAGQTVKRVGAFAQAAVGNIQIGYGVAQGLTIDGYINVRDNITAGILTAGEITTNSLTITSENISIGGQTLRDYIATIVVDVLSKQSGSQQQNTTTTVSGLELVESGIKNQESRINDLEAVLASSSAVLGASTVASDSGEARDTRDTLDTRGTLSLDSLSVDGLATISSSLRVKQNSLVEGMLTVIDTVMTKNLVVSGLSSFLNDVVFTGPVSFSTPPTFSKDTAGFAIIKKDSDRVEVVFDKPYENTPIVNVSISLDETPTPTPDPTNPSDTNDPNEVLSQKVLASEVSYIVTKRTTKGFTILLNKSADEDIPFSWTALVVDDPHTFESKPTILPTPTISVLSPTPAGGNIQGEEVIQHEGNY